MTDQASNLLGCPFCGRQPLSCWHGGTDATGEQYGYHAIECCDIYVHEESEAEAVAKWNKRHAVEPKTTPPATTCPTPDNQGAQGDDSEVVKPAAGGVALLTAANPMGRDADWVLAIGHALGLDSGYNVPIVPRAEVFRELFDEIRRRASVPPNDDRAATIKLLCDRLERINQHVYAKNLTLLERLMLIDRISGGFMDPTASETKADALPDAGDPIKKGGPDYAARFRK